MHKTAVNLIKCEKKTKVYVSPTFNIINLDWAPLTLHFLYHPYSLFPQFSRPDNRYGYRCEKLKTFTVIYLSVP
jgi:hypothetical protein